MKVFPTLALSWAFLAFAASPAEGVGCSSWFDRDGPSGSGDYELVPTQVPLSAIACPDTYIMEARKVGTDGPIYHTESEVYNAVQKVVHFNYVFPAGSGAGISCRNTEHAGPGCLDFEVRFCCLT